MRIQSIFRKSLDSGQPFEAPTRDGVLALTEVAELKLAKQLNQFGEILPQALADYKPNILANYLFELASCFHSFFETCPVLKSEEPARSSRLTLCHVTARTLRQGLELLGIGVPERM